MADLKYELARQEDNANDAKAADDHVIKGESKQGFAPRQKTLCILVLCVLLFVILLLIIGLIVLGVQLHDAKKPKEPEICLTIDCIDTVSGLMESVDPKVDPCDNFYQYACGNWEKKNPMPIQKTYWTQMSILREKNEKIIRKLITSKEIRANYSRIEALRKTFLSYDACMDEKTIKKLGGEPMNRMIDALGSSPGLNATWSASAWDFTESLVALTRDYTVSAFFTSVIVPSPSNSSMMDVKVYSGALKLRTSRYNSTSKENIKVKKAYRKYMIQTFMLLGREENQSTAMAESIFEFEKQNALLLERTVSQRKSIPTPIGELDAYGNSTISWLRFATRLFQGTGVVPTIDMKIIVDAPDYFKELPTLLANFSNGDLANYMVWRAIEEYNALLSEPFNDVRKEFYKVFGYNGPQQESPRWEKCVPETKRYFGFAVGRMFIDEAFRNGSKEEATEMVEDIKKVFIADFGTVDWMDSKTRAAATEKATKLYENIGYPDWILDNEKLTKYYSSETIGNDTYFDNIISVMKVDFFKSLKQLNRPVNRQEWNIYPTTVNAQYITVFNSMELPAGILQPPFFKKTYPLSANFGGIGAIIGHEMTHGFDDSGRTYNPDGNRVKWWTNASIETFNERAKCFEEVYSNYTYAGKNLNGNRVLGEAIADNAGTKLSYSAYKVWVEDHGEEPQLPGIKLNHDQVFFLSYARGHGTKIQPVRFSVQPDMHMKQMIVQGQYHVIAPFNIQPTLLCRPFEVCRASQPFHSINYEQINPKLQSNGNEKRNPLLHGEMVLQILSKYITETACFIKTGLKQRAKEIEIFCSAVTDAEARTIMRYNFHPLNPLRINGVMSNSEEFAKAFNCPKDSPMNPSHKCAMW